MSQSLASSTVATGSGAIKAVGPHCKSCSAAVCDKFCAVLPRGFGHVILTGGASIFVNFWLSAQVMKARKEFKVEYPLLYSPDNNFDNKFNCIQRGHQNFLESYPGFLALLFTGGIANPQLASIFGFTYLAGRVLYMKGYQGGPDGRRKGAIISHLGELGLLVLSLKLAYHLFKLQGCTFCKGFCSAFGLCKK